jgi:hypothetical protein
MPRIHGEYYELSTDENFSFMDENSTVNLVIDQFERELEEAGISLSMDFGELQ